MRRPRALKSSLLVATFLAALAAPTIASAQGYTRTALPAGMTSIANEPGASILFDGAFGRFDDATANAPLPFSFDFFGTTVTDVLISTNGFVTFDTGFTGSGFINAVLPSTATPNNYIAPFWDDLIVDTGSPAQIITFTQGAAPNRTFIIEYQSMSRLGQASSVLTAQVRISEGTNIIEIHYDTNNVWLNVTATAGLENAAGDFGVGALDGASNTSVPPGFNLRFDPGPQGADLIADAVSVTPTSASPGDTLSIDANVVNAGTAAAGAAFDVDVVLSTDTIIDANDTVIGTVTIPAAAALSVDNPLSISAVIPANTTPATYYVGIVIDGANAIAETSDANNVSLKPTEVNIANLVDLVATDITHPGGASFAPGDSFTYTRSISNASNNPAPAFRVEVFLSTNTTITRTDTLIEDFTFTNGLAANTTDDSTITVNLPATLAPGIYFLGMLIDEDDQVFESDETNNELAGLVVVDVVPAFIADLSADAITTTQTTVLTGNTLTFTRTITNTGPDPVPAFRVETFLSTNNIISRADTLIDDFTFPNGLAAGATDTATVTVTVPGTLNPQDYFLGYLIDEDDQITETDETNNEAFTATPITVIQGAPGIDVVVDLVTATAANPSAPGAAITVNINMLNLGANDAGAFRGGVYLSTDNVIDTTDIFVGSVDVSGLLSGASSGPSSALMSLPATIAPGDYFVGVIADDQGAVTESDETNNTGFDATPITIGGGIVGDLNGDGLANALDIQTCINQVNGRGNPIPAADVNSDGRVDVLDIQLTINAALGTAP